MTLRAEAALFACVTIGVLVTALWIAGAIYFDFCAERQWGRWLAIAWMAGVVVVFVAWRPIWLPILAYVCAAVSIFVLWLQMEPSHNRDWMPEVAVLPRATSNGETITIENVRNFSYRSLTDFTPSYETRTFHLAHAQGVDIIFFTWGSKWMSHPVLVFDFGPDGRICVSIEVRYQKGQKYSILYSLFRKYELIYLVSDERDAILRRTKYGVPQDARLYRLNAPADEVRTVFMDYVEAINDLYKSPRWYHGLCTNCTTSFYQLRHSRRRCDWRVIVNGRLDRALYEDNRLDRSLPYPVLYEFAKLNDIAVNAPDVGFGDHIRRELERRRHER